MICTLNRYGDEIEKKIMDRACGTYGRQERYTVGFGGDTLGKETTWRT